MLLASSPASHRLSSGRRNVAIVIPLDRSSKGRIVRRYKRLDVGSLGVRLELSQHRDFLRRQSETSSDARLRPRAAKGRESSLVLLAPYPR